MAAVAMSGYWWAYRVRTSSTESLGSGSGSRTPLNSNIRESTWLSIRVRGLLVIELDRVRAWQVGTAREMLEHISILPDPPLLILTSRLADERLWAEGLNLGAWDVLAKPFQTEEAIRVVDSAWRPCTGCRG